MKLSPSTIRRLRTERGWSQEQLAIASGLSLRTIQRMESEGIASMGSAVSLAATFNLPLLELQNAPDESRGNKPAFGHSTLFLGFAVITVAAIIDGARPHGPPPSNFFMTVIILATFVGILITVPAIVHLVRKRQLIAVALAMFGTPLVTLLAAGVIYAFASNRVPSWHLIVIGAAGIALVIMAARELHRAHHSPGT